MLLGTTSITSTDERRYAMSVLNAVLGGGMSSRLFQEVREKRGLAYSVYSFAQGFSDTGYFGLYAGCAPGKVDQVLALMRAELERLAEGGISEEELERGIGQLRGGLVLGMEDTGSRMSRLGKAELVFGEYVGLEEQLSRIGSVTGRRRPGPGRRHRRPPPLPRRRRPVRRGPRLRQRPLLTGRRARRKLLCSPNADLGANSGPRNRHSASKAALGEHGLSQPGL